MEMSPAIREIRLDNLKKDKEKLFQDYQGVAEKKRREGNPVEKHNLQLQLGEIAKQIEEIEEKTEKIKKEAEENKSQIQKLQEILSQFKTKEELSIVKQAYRACSPEGWIHFSTDKPEEILADVEKMLEKKDLEYTRTEYFVVCLLTLIKNPSLVHLLKKWAEENINNFDNLFQQELAVKRKNKNPYLIVRIEESSDKDYYFVNAWFIPDGNTYHYADNLDCEAIFHHQDRDRDRDRFTLKEISEKIIIDYLIQVGGKCLRFDNPSNKLTVEIFLPNDLIFEAVDSWEMKDGLSGKVPRLGSQHKVVVRLSKRIEPLYIKLYKISWDRKWQALNKNIKVNQAFIDDLSQLNNDDTIGIYFAKTGKKSVNFDDMVRYGIPLALCLRRKTKSDIQLSQLLGCCINELIQTVAEKRIEAFSQPNNNSHIGHHISLLWENPYRLPPNIHYSMSSN